MKGSIALDDASPDGLTLYGRLCAAALAVRSCPSRPSPALLTGCIGKSTAFDDSLTTFSGVICRPERPGLGSFPGSDPIRSSAS